MEALLRESYRSAAAGHAVRGGYPTSGTHDAATLHCPSGPSASSTVAQTPTPAPAKYVDGIVDVLFDESASRSRTSSHLQSPQVAAWTAPLRTGVPRYSIVTLVKAVRSRTSPWRHTAVAKPCRTPRVRGSRSPARWTCRTVTRRQLKKIIQLVTARPRRMIWTPVQAVESRP